MAKADYYLCRQERRVKKVKKNISLNKTCELYAPNRDRNFYDDYVEDILSPSERKTFEKHLQSCLHCSRQVGEAIKRDEMVETSYALSEIGQRKTLKDILLRMREMVCQINVPTEYIALAASPFRSRRPKIRGVTYGVAVNKETNQGALLKCVAAVSGKLPNQSPLEVRARELKSHVKDGMEYKVSVPSTLLENLLKDLFVTHPLLKPLQLYEKTIRVHVDFTDGNPNKKRAASGTLKSNNCFIYEAESLELAVLIAILSAVKGKIVDSDIVFSSGVSLNGYLEGVGDLEQKIAVAGEYRIKSFILAKENRSLSLKEAFKKTGGVLLYFDKLQDVLKYLGLVDKIIAKKAVRKNSGLPEKKVLQKPSSVKTTKQKVALSRKKLSNKK